MCCVLHRMWDIKAILLYASVAENEFFTRTRSLKARKAARSCTNTYTLERNANTHTHKHARLATSPALGSASICQFPVSNKMDGWRMEIMVETQPHTLASFHCERAPLHSATTLMPREGHLPRVIPHFVLSYHPPARIHPSQNTNIYLEHLFLLSLYIIFTIYSAIYNYLMIIMRLYLFILLQLYIVIITCYVLCIYTEYFLIRIWEF